MFSNPIKRFSESIAQAQEQARQQLQKAQHRSSTDSKPFFDAETENETAQGGETTKVQDDTEEPKVTSSEEGQNTWSTDKKDMMLPKDVRIKLAKLAKYEDRHPSNRPSFYIINHFRRITGCV